MGPFDPPPSSAVRFLRKTGTNDPKIPFFDESTRIFAVFDHFIRMHSPVKTHTFHFFQRKKKNPSFRKDFLMFLFADGSLLKAQMQVRIDLRGVCDRHQCPVAVFG